VTASITVAKRLLRDKLLHLSAAKQTLPIVRDLKSIIRLEVPVSDCCPLQWLSWQNQTVQIYWSDRQRIFTAAGIGYADRIKCDTEKNQVSFLNDLNDVLDRHDGRARYYGGMRFNPKTSTDIHWLPYGTCFFILPRFELFSDTTGAYLACHIVISPEKPLAEQLPLVLTELDHIREKGNHEENQHAKTKYLLRQDFPEQKKWLNNVESALTRLEANDTDKIVLGRSTVLHFNTPPKATTLLENLQQIEPSAYHFYLQPELNSAFLGATPERLYKRQDHWIESEAVAGTRPRGTTPQTDKALAEQLLQSEKDYREHIIVRNNIATILQRCCQTLTVSPDIKLLTQSRVQHLYSHIHGQLRTGTSDSDLLAQLHPTPAVGGLPRAKALRDIAQIEPFDRGWYAGPIGWIGSRQAEFAVGIRSGLLNGKSLRLFAGAGVVAGSVPQSEWEEMENKISVFLNALELA